MIGPTEEGKQANGEEMRIWRPARPVGLGARGGGGGGGGQRGSPRLSRLLLGGLLVSLVLLALVSEGEVEAKKFKEKKLLKGLVKKLILKNLSTRKNFLPMPVPIPGKWQQILTTVLDSGLLQADSPGQTKFNFAGLAPVLGAGRRGSKLSGQKQQIDMNSVKKYSRLAAAKYASKLISNQAPTVKRSSILFPRGNNQNNNNNNTNKPFAISNNRKSSSHQNNRDLLVTFYNLVKLIQQFRQLDRTKLIDLTRKSNPVDANKLPPVLSMNINNKKSLANKMNYIHKLTSNLNHRHRHQTSHTFV